VLAHEGHGLRVGDPQMPPRTTTNTSFVSSKRGFVDGERLEDERPPPTAIGHARSPRASKKEHLPYSAYHS